MTKWQPTNWEEIFINHITDRGKYPVYKTQENQINLLKVGYRADQRFSQEQYQMAETQLKIVEQS